MGLFSATTISVDDVRRDYGHVLLPGENVLAAFKTVRDVVFLSNLRFVLVDVQGLTGKKVEVKSIPYRAITMFSVETAGTFDVDADLRIWISGVPQPVQVGIGRNSDVSGIQQILARHVLGQV